jgi:hypothetical protein
MDYNCNPFFFTTIMKYSRPAGIIAAIALMIFCNVPWVHIESIQTTITGFYSGSTNFGKPGYVQIFFSITAILLFLIQQVWSARVNILICTLNFAWALRNFLVLGRCEMGECPEKRYGIYLVVLFAFIMVVMSLLPKVKLKVEEV